MKDKAIYNVKINIGEWPKGPFSDIEELKRAYKNVIDVEPFLGDFILMNSHELKRGYEKGLHTKEFIDQNYHLSWKGSGVIYLFKKGKKIVTEYYPQKSLLPPHYTLGRLYETLSHQTYEAKMSAMRNELEKHGLNEELGNFDKSLAKNKRLRLLLLENLYKKYISDQ